MADILPKPDDSSPIYSEVDPDRSMSPRNKRTILILVSLVVIGALCLLAGYTYDFINNHNQDNTRKQDLAYISTTLSGYYNLYREYPTLKQINSSTFGAFAPSLDRSKFEDPSSTSKILYARPSSGGYAYKVTPTNCNNTTVTCTGYTLTATLSDGSYYTISKSPQKN